MFEILVHLVLVGCLPVGCDNKRIAKWNVVALIWVLAYLIPLDANWIAKWDGVLHDYWQQTVYDVSGGRTCTCKYFSLDSRFLESLVSFVCVLVLCWDCFQVLLVSVMSQRVMFFT